MAVPTVDEAVTEFLECASYESERSLELANRFQTVITQLLILLPKMQADQNSSIAMNSQELLVLLSRVNAFIGAVTASGSVKYIRVTHARR